MHDEQTHKNLQQPSNKLCEIKTKTKKTINGNYFGVDVQILYGYVFLEREEKKGQKKCHCQSVSAVTFNFLFVILYVWKMIFSIYGAVWNG